jgi:hypothetical protein
MPTKLVASENMKGVFKRKSGNNPTLEEETVFLKKSLKASV